MLFNMYVYLKFIQTITNTAFSIIRIEERETVIIKLSLIYTFLIQMNLLKYFF